MRFCDTTQRVAMFWHDSKSQVSEKSDLGLRQYAFSHCLTLRHSVQAIMAGLPSGTASCNTTSPQPSQPGHLSFPVTAPHLPYNEVAKIQNLFLECVDRSVSTGQIRNETVKTNKQKLTRFSLEIQCGKGLSAH